ncbi:unnamed protein product [Cuscuta campestris]|uniref:Retrotransposon Copia-like N-terminal domain-containing protein n=1 Tax=Cuscuta campestris TaxID=132261 RepID=A0A484N7B8_9ASTE|nr:unnamed protein product [Cuscuta campestris]
MHEDLRRKKQRVILVEKEKQCVNDNAGTCCAFPTFYSNDDGSDGDVDPKEMLIMVEEKFQESLRVNKKKYLENDSLKHELDESKRNVEQLTKELHICKAKVIAEDDTDDDIEDDTEVDTTEELVILQRKWVELQANKKTVIENHQLVAEQNRLKEDFHKWMRTARAKAIEEQVNISKFGGDKTGLGFVGSERNKTPLDLFIDQRKEVSQKAPQRRKLEAAKFAGTSSARPDKASHVASARTSYTVPYIITFSDGSSEGDSLKYGTAVLCVVCVFTINMTTKKANLIHDPSSIYYLHPSEGPSNSLTKYVLHSDNYDVWKKAVLHALGARGKAKFLTATGVPKPTDEAELGAWESNHSIICSWLCNSVDESIQQSIISHMIAYDLWNDLKKRYGGSNGPRMYQLKCELHNLRQKAAAVCHARVEREKTMDFLLGLDDEQYRHAHSQILGTEPIPDLDRAFYLVTQEERHRTIIRSRDDRTDGVAFADFTSSSSHSSPLPMADFPTLPTADPTLSPSSQPSASQPTASPTATPSSQPGSGEQQAAVPVPSTEAAGAAPTAAAPPLRQSSRVRQPPHLLSDYVCHTALACPPAPLPPVASPVSASNYRLKLLPIPILSLDHLLRAEGKKFAAQLHAERKLI